MDGPWWCAPAGGSRCGRRRRPVVGPARPGRRRRAPRNSLSTMAVAPHTCRPPTPKYGISYSRPSYVHEVTCHVVGGREQAKRRLGDAGDLAVGGDEVRPIRGRADDRVQHETAHRNVQRRQRADHLHVARGRPRPPLPLRGAPRPPATRRGRAVLPAATPAPRAAAGGSPAASARRWLRRRARRAGSARPPASPRRGPRPCASRAAGGAPSAPAQVPGSGRASRRRRWAVTDARSSRRMSSSRPELSRGSRRDLAGSSMPRRRRCDAPLGGRRRSEISRRPWLQDVTRGTAHT